MELKKGAVIRNDSSLFLKFVGYIVDHGFRRFPAQAGVGDRLSEHLIGTNLLRTIHQITFYHESFDHLGDKRVVTHAVQNLGNDAGLLVEMFSGVVMIGVHDDGWVFESLFGIGFGSVL